MIDEIKDIDLEYNSSAFDHYFKAEELLNKTKHIKDYFYISLEIRMCVERLCFEYYYLLTRYIDKSLSNQDLKLYQPNKIFPRLKKEVPFF